MAILRGGTTAANQEVESNSKAARVAAYPFDSTLLLGAYMVNVYSGALIATVAAQAPLFSFRWTDPSKVAMIRGVTIGYRVVSTITTAVAFGFEIVLAASFSVSDTGGTAVNLTGHNQKKRSVYPSSAVGDMRIAATAALTPGTRSLDAQSIGALWLNSGTSANSVPASGSTLAGFNQPAMRTADEPRLILAQNEGFIIQTTDAGPATGTFQIAVNVVWDEFSSFPA